MGTRLVTHAVVVEDDAQLHTAELRVGDFVDEGAVGEPGEGGGTRGWETMLRRMEDVATVMQVQIAHRLVPDASKEGYEEGVDAREGGGAASGEGASGRMGRVPQRGEVEGGPLRGDARVIDPLRDDGLRIGDARYPRIGGFGRDDLVAPGLPGGPEGMFGGMGGNLMGPRNFIGMGRGGGRPEGVPPGARFDPYGPVIPDNDIERVPGFEDEHGLRMGDGRGMGMGRGRGSGSGSGSGSGRGAGSGGGFGEGPPPGMYW